MSPGPAPQPAYEHNGRAIGREAFYAIACDPGRSCVVEACAGAGKTWMLVSRILRALLAGVPAHEILAITFTRKAAGEMRERLEGWLAEFADATREQRVQALIDRGIEPQAASMLPEQLQNLYQTVLAQGRGVQIRTFHGWFAALVRAAPWAVLRALGLPADYVLVENDEDALAAVWRPFYQAVADDAALAEDFTALVRAHGRGNTHKALAEALARRIEFARADAAGVVEGSVQPWHAVFPDLPAAADPETLLSGAPGDLHRVLLACARRMGRGSAIEARQAALLEQATGEGRLAGVLEALFTLKGEPRKFSEMVRADPAFRAGEALALRLRAACAQHAAWLHHGRVARLARRLVDEFARLKRARGWVDMGDLERAALHLMTDPVLSGWVHERLNARVAQLLVDEFQDTSPLQWQALSAWLAGYAGAGGGAGLAVFIVGDPKQSIYRFRGAQPQVFSAAQAFVREGLGGDLLACDHTRRNAPAVLAAVNGVMAQAQAQGQWSGWRPHTTQSQAAGRLWRLPAIAADAGAAAASTVADGWRDSLVTPRQRPEERRIALECRQAAAWLAGRIAAGTLRPADVLVLARKGDRLAAMREALAQAGIAAELVEPGRLGEAPEVQDVVALLDALVSPQHDLSLARALRSPLFGLPDEALLALATLARAARAAGTPRPWFDLLQEQELPRQDLIACAADLAMYRQWVAELPPHDALEAIYHHDDLLARYAQASPAPQRPRVLANLRALLGAALAHGGGRHASAYALVRALKAGGPPAGMPTADDRIAAAEAPPGAGAGPARESLAAEPPGAVRLLTVHKAKGLEAPLVLLLDADAAPPRASSMGVLCDWPGEAPAPRRFAFLASERDPPPCTAAAVETEQAARAHEELNALYVSLTRARQELVVSSMARGREVEGATWWERLLPWCEPVPLQALAPAPAAAVAPAPAEPAQPARLRLPSVSAAPAPPAGHAIESKAARTAPVRLTAGSRPGPAPSGDPGATAGADFGSALHRLLEWWRPGGWPAGLPERVAAEFALAPEVAQQAQAAAQTILNGEARWAWDPAALAWAGNEVELVVHGELLRIDRLVRLRQGDWWVLDFKSEHHPERDPALRAQLARYRQAVAALQPGEAVHAAFVTGQGRLVPA